MTLEVEMKGVPTISNTPWVHRGRGVIVNARKLVLGAFENARDAEAAVAAVNLLADIKDHQP